MSRLLAIFALLASSVQAQTSVTIPSQTVTVVIPAQTIALAPTPTCAPPQVLQNGLCATPASGSTFWVYHNGVFAWAGDFSWGVQVDYANAIVKPGSKVIAIKVIGKNGGYQPYAQNGAFDTTPYKYFVYCAMPTMAGQVFGTGFAAIDDVGDGPNGVSIPANVGISGSTSWGPLPAAGKWGCYKIPLSYFQFNNPSILKFSIADGTGYDSNQFYLDNVGFTP
jgi:hypothetical protein